MSTNRPDDPAKAISFLVADALESLIPLVDTWASNVETRLHGQHPLGYADGFSAGVQQMTAEVKDQLIERILRLRD